MTEVFLEAQFCELEFEVEQLVVGIDYLANREQSLLDVDVLFKQNHAVFSQAIKFELDFPLLVVFLVVHENLLQVVDFVDFLNDLQLNNIQVGVVVRAEITHLGFNIFNHLPQKL